MINLLARKITNIITTSEYSKYDSEVYTYGLFIILSSIYLLFVSLALGLIFHNAIESIIFFIVFTSIRMFAGGYHAKSEFACEMISSILFFCCVLGMYLVKKYPMYLSFVYYCFWISILLVFIFCPLDSAEKSLSRQEKLKYRKISRVILLLNGIINLICFILKIEMIASPICFAIILQSFLIIMGKIKLYHNNG